MGNIYVARYLRKYGFTVHRKSGFKLLGHVWRTQDSVDWGQSDRPDWGNEEIERFNMH